MIWFTLNPLCTNFSSFGGDLKSNHSKSGLFQDWIFNGLLFKVSGFSYIYSCNPTKTGPDFKWFLTKWQPFVQFSNLEFRSRPFTNQPLVTIYKSRLSGFQIPTVQKGFIFHKINISTNNVFVCFTLKPWYKEDLNKEPDWYSGYWDWFVIQICPLFKS